MERTTMFDGQSAVVASNIGKKHLPLAGSAEEWKMFGINGIRMAAAVVAIGAMVAIAPAHAGPAENKANAIGFMQMLHEGPGKIDAAFAKYVGPRYVQHNPRVPDGIEGAKGFLKMVMSHDDPSKPASTYEVVKAVADDDYVVIHAHIHSNRADQPDSSLIDWLKFENGKIVEHWDTIQQVPEKSANNNTLFGK